MTTPFVDRPPTEQEIERLRLVLSTFQDGTGMLRTRDGDSLPGWRDFERSVALVFGGLAPETKLFFDVLLADQSLPNLYYGISCKMKEHLRKGQKGQAYLEITNADGAIWDALSQVGLSKGNHLSFPAQTGTTILALIEKWRREATIFDGRPIDVDRSLYLTLQYDRNSREYQLLQYSPQLPDAESLTWEAGKRSIRGRRHGRVILEYFGYSGSQVKYYPLIVDAVWQSPVFKLEPIPDGAGFGLKDKAALYFPDQWQTANRAVSQGS